MPVWLHIILSVLLIAYFVYNYIKNKYFYFVLFVVWIASTLLKYPFQNNRTLLLALGIFQVIMFILVVFFMFKRSGEQRTKTLEMIAKMSADSLPNEDEISDTPNPPKENESPENTN